MLKLDQGAYFNFNLPLYYGHFFKKNLTSSVFLSLRTLECESLIRKMLVREPTKRYCIEQIKRHRWMTEETPRLLPPINILGDVKSEPNEQILRLMNSLGIDAAKTKEVRIIQIENFSKYLP